MIHSLGEWFWLEAAVARHWAFIVVSIPGRKVTVKPSRIDLSFPSIPTKDGRGWSMRNRLKTLPMPSASDQTCLVG